MKTKRVEEEIQYVAKSGDKYRTCFFGYTENIFNAGFYNYPLMTIRGKEKCIPVRVTTLIEELREAGN